MKTKLIVVSAAALAFVMLTSCVPQGAATTTTIDPFTKDLIVEARTSYLEYLKTRNAAKALENAQALERIKAQQPTFPVTTPGQATPEPVIAAPSAPTATTSVLAPPASTSTYATTR